jgi:hypothetical protein
MTASSPRRAERRRMARDQRRDGYVLPAIAGAADAARRAGVSRPIITSLPDTPWAADDHDWFARNPTRAHRVRPAFPREAQESAWPTETPDGYALLIAVRQIEPGERLRASFFRSLAAPDLSHLESFCHALFDALSSDDPRELADSLIVKRALAYEAAKGGGRS